MKRTISLFSFLLVLSTGLCQSFSLSFNDLDLPNGSTIGQQGTPDTLQILTWLKIRNLTPETKEVMMRKEEIIMQQDAASSLCWAGYCYNSGMVVTSFPLVMQPGDSAEGCFGHFAPYGARGVSIIRWIFFDAREPADSLSITVEYSMFPLSAGQDPDPGFNLAAGGFQGEQSPGYINYRLPSGYQGIVEIANLQGEILFVSGMVSGRGQLNVPRHHYPAGIYLCRMRVNGMAVPARKFFITR